MALAIALLATALFLGIAAAFVETRDREPTRQSWTGDRTSADWPSRGMHLLSGLAFTFGAWIVIDHAGWGPALAGFLVFVPGILLSLYLDRRKARRSSLTTRS